MSYLGSWKIDDVLTFYANTHRFDTGAATDADSVATYRVYEDETSTPLLTGSMALLDSANTAGFYSEQITLSAANGFEKGKRYTIYITATVNSVAGATHHTFQMEAEVDANVVSGAVPSVTGAVGSVTGNVGGNVVGSVGSVTGNVGGNVVGSTGSVTGAVGSVTGNVGGNVAGSVASVTGNVGGNVVGSVGSVTGNVGGNVVGSVGSLTANNDKTGYRLSSTGVDDILDEAITEPAGVFAWGSATLRNIIGWLGALASNPIDQTSTTQTLRNRADNADIASSTVSDNGTTGTRGEFS